MHVEKNFTVKVTQLINVRTHAPWNGKAFQTWWKLIPVLYWHNEAGWYFNQSVHLEFLKLLTPTGSTKTSVICLRFETSKFECSNSLQRHVRFNQKVMYAYSAMYTFLSVTEKKKIENITRSILIPSNLQGRLLQFRCSTWVQNKLWGRVRKNSKRTVRPIYFKSFFL